MTTATPAVPASGYPATIPLALEAINVTVRFGGLLALSEVSLEVAPGTIAGLVGPNGAGKSTLLGVLSGLQRSNAGTVLMHGEDVTSTSARGRAQRGLARTFSSRSCSLVLRCASTWFWRTAPARIESVCGGTCSTRGRCSHRQWKRRNASTHCSSSCV